MTRLVIASQMGSDFDHLLSGAGGLDIIPVPAEAPAHAALDADILWATPLGGWAKMAAPMPGSWPGRLRWAQIASAGIDAFPSWFFDRLPVACTRGNNATPIAEYVVLSVLAHAKSWDEIRIHAAADWRHMRTLRRIEETTIAVLGLGAIGTEIVKRALAFDMKVRILRRSTGAPAPPGTTACNSVAEAVAGADHVVVALAYTRETDNLIDRSAFRAMTPGVHIVNIARGPIIDHDALREALDEGIVAHATLDVTHPEPLPAGHPLYTDPRVDITPHISWSNLENAERVSMKFLENIKRYRSGLPIEGLVEPARGY
jgi:phosphoglycerate dehydrogenase-like enzyme